jgi:hypothetical protein
MKTRTAITKINDIGKQCWLMVRADVSNFNRLPTECTPMNRFLFRADCFTSLDAEILPDGNLKILHNGHFQDRYPEDAAFAIPELSVGQIVDPKVIVANTRIYVGIANQRAKYPQGEVVRKLPPHLRRKLNLRSSFFDVMRLKEDYEKEQKAV